MQPYLASYATLSSNELRAMLAYRVLIQAAHASQVEAEMRLRAINYILDWRASHEEHRKERGRRRRSIGITIKPATRGPYLDREPTEGDTYATPRRRIN